MDLDLNPTDFQVYDGFGFYKFCLTRFRLDLDDVKCQRMLVIAICEMSNASRWHQVAKSHQDHQGSQRQQLQTLVTF